MTMLYADTAVRFIFGITNKMNKIIDGFKFGMLLQIAIGPVCFFIFQITLSHGIIPALSAAIGVTLIDSFYIILAILGIGKFMEKNPETVKILKYFGSLVLILFGLSMLISLLGNSSPVNSSLAHFSKLRPFVSACLLTISNPLTIIFWTGVFASKTASDNMKFRELIFFGIGSIFSTLVFLSIISIVGHYTRMLINNQIIILLNIFIGTVLVFFGIKPFLRRKRIIGLDCHPVEK